MIKEFASLQEKKQFEKNRINYYLNGIGASPFEFYKNVFIETFTKEGRRLKKLYDGYKGGYYRDEHGHIHADHICLLSLNEFNEDDIVFVEDSTKRVYIKNNNEKVFPIGITKEAKWEISCDGYYPYCINCNNEPKSGLMTQYCPSCGAKMSNPKE